MLLYQYSNVAILPEHLHCIWRLPEGDADYSSRWREIKKATSRQISTATNARHERNVWQRRFWEHTIRDEEDWRKHIFVKNDMYGRWVNGTLGKIEDLGDDFVKVKDALKAKGFTPASAEVSMKASTTVKVEGEDAKKVIKLVSILEDHDDVQAVHANFDISADILEQAS